MTVGLALALTQIATVQPAPVPAPRLSPYFSEAVKRAVSAVRAKDWESLRSMCGSTLYLAVYTVPSAEQVAFGMLFDDEYAPAEDDIMAFSYRGTSIDTHRPPSAYFLRQFRYFADLVDESCRNSVRWPQFGQGAKGMFNKNLGGPAAWGQHAPNAAWRIEFMKSPVGWTIKRLVVETQ